MLVSWDGCYGDTEDERYKMFLAKLSPEMPPAAVKEPAEASQPAVAAVADETSPQVSIGGDETEESFTTPTRYLHREEHIGDKYGFYSPGNWHEDWGGKHEKWLKGRRLDDVADNSECWYYILPGGDVFRWDAVDAPMASLARLVQRRFAGKQLQGTLVHSFGPELGDWYYRDPRRLRPQLFKTVTTGPDVLASLTRAGGELDATRSSMAKIIKKRPSAAWKERCLVQPIRRPGRKRPASC